MRKKIFNKKWEFISVGSDESGKGDFFGAPSVAAVELNEITIEKLKKTGWFHEIQDSKKCTDIWIKEKAPEIMKICNYKYVDLKIPQYLKLYDKYKNMNQILAIIHNKLHESLSNKQIPHVIDGFVNSQKYYEYLGNYNKTKIKDFCINGESTYLSIALASIIARFLFINKIEKMRIESGIQIPYGNRYEPPNSVIDAYKELKRKYSEKEINERFIKNHFSTLQKIKEILQDS